MKGVGAGEAGRDVEGGSEASWEDGGRAGEMTGRDVARRDPDRVQRTGSRTRLIQVLKQRLGSRLTQMKMKMKMGVFLAAWDGGLETSAPCTDKGVQKATWGSPESELELWEKLREQMGAWLMQVGDADACDQGENNLETSDPYKSRGDAVESGNGWTQQAQGEKEVEGQMFGEHHGRPE